MRPLQGVRVIEVAGFIFVPAAGAALADWGADVIKIEHPEHGDALRGLNNETTRILDGLHLSYELWNRGKRSVGLDLATEAGRDVLMRLVEGADVYLTNMLPSSRTRLRLDPADVFEHNPNIVYARGSGQGPRGDEAGHGGYDILSFWYRTGMADGVTPANAEYPTTMPSYAFGDSISGQAMAGAVSTALVGRNREQKGVVVDVSLLNVGLWAMQTAVATTHLTGSERIPWAERAQSRNPLSATYRTSDGRYVALGALQADRYWSELCHAIGAAHLATDERFSDATRRAEHSEECVAALDAIFQSEPADHWTKVLATQRAQWAKVQRANEQVDDPQALANGYVTTMERRGRDVPFVRAPAQFDLEEPELSPAPALGQHTDEILLDAGYTWDELIALKVEGAIS